MSPAWPLRPGQKVRVEFYKYPEEALHYFWEAEVVEVRHSWWCSIVTLTSVV